MFWEVQIFLPPISPFLQYKVEAHNPFRSTVEDIQNSVCVYLYIYSYTASFALKWWERKSREKGGNDNSYRVPILTADKPLWVILQIYFGDKTKKAVYLFSFEVSVIGKEKRTCFRCPCAQTWCWVFVQGLSISKCRIGVLLEFACIHTQVLGKVLELNSWEILSLQWATEALKSLQ